MDGDTAPFEEGREYKADTDPAAPKQSINACPVGDLLAKHQWREALESAGGPSRTSPTQSKGRVGQS